MINSYSSDNEAPHKNWADSMWTELVANEYITVDEAKVLHRTINMHSIMCQIIDTVPLSQEINNEVLANFIVGDTTLYVDERIYDLPQVDGLITEEELQNIGTEALDNPLKTGHTISQLSS